MSSYKEQIEQMYGSQLASQKEQLKNDYDTALSDLDASSVKAQKAMDQQMTATRVDAQKRAVNDAEYYAANGLSSGARAQARLAQDNQLQSNLTAIRTAQMNAEAETERQRQLLAQDYASAIRKAQADNDLALAQALYQDAKEEESRLLAQQEAAAGLMAQTGDFSLYGSLYGLTDAQTQALNTWYANNYGTGSSSSGSSDSSDGGWDNGGYGSDIVEKAQEFVGTSVDGKWGKNSAAKAKEKGHNSLAEVVAAMGENGDADNIQSFKNRNMTREQAISRGIGETSWKAMILKALNDANLTVEEFAALEKYYGIS